MRLAVPDIFTEDGDNLGIGLGVEVVSSLDEDVFELLVYIVSDLSRVNASATYSW